MTSNQFTFDPRIGIAMVEPVTVKTAGKYICSTGKSSKEILVYVEREWWLFVDSNYVLLTNSNLASLKTKIYVISSGVASLLYTQFNFFVGSTVDTYRFMLTYVVYNIISQLPEFAG